MTSENENEGSTFLQNVSIYPENSNGIITHKTDIFTALKNSDFTYEVCNLLLNIGNTLPD